MKRLIHVKTILQHVFVVVDDTPQGTEFQSEPVVIPASEFEQFQRHPESFEQQRVEQEQALNEEPE
jgi:hypothetical protein